jgi:hypothetical protein
MTPPAPVTPQVLVIADASAPPAFVAADLLSQAEHGKDSQVVLVALPGVDLEAVAEQVEMQRAALPRGDIAAEALGHSFVVKVDDKATAAQVRGDLCVCHACAVRVGAGAARWERFPPALSLPLPIRRWALLSRMCVCGVPEAWALWAVSKRNETVQGSQPLALKAQRCSHSRWLAKLTKPSSLRTAMTLLQQGLAATASVPYNARNQLGTLSLSHAADALLMFTHWLEGSSPICTRRST